MPTFIEHVPQFLYHSIQLPLTEETSHLLSTYYFLGQVLSTKVFRPKPANYLCLSIKFYWSTTVSIHLCIVYGCLLATTAELNSCNRNLMAL